MYVICSETPITGAVEEYVICTPCEAVHQPEKIKGL